MLVRITKPLVLADGRPLAEGQEVHLDEKIARNLQKAKLAEPITERAVPKKKKETRNG